jgi:hypothetical protein
VEQNDEIVGLAAAKIRLQAQNDRGIWPRPKQPAEGLIQQDTQTLTLIRVCLCEKHSWVGSVALVDDSVRQAGLMRRRRRRRRVPPPQSGFAGFRFPREVIVLAVRWYLRYGLSYRDVEELLAERGVTVDHVTVFRWVQRFTPLLIDAARACQHAPGDRWFVDETYVKVAGRWRYVYRAIDQFGQVIDVRPPADSSPARWARPHGQRK